ncbi:MAG: hypothetical protein WDZ85_03130 [Candidatus Paceibacterota bacterium]
MALLGDFLAKYKKGLFEWQIIIETAQKTIKELLKIEIEAKKITYKNKKIYIKTSPLIKTEIIINKEELLSRINNTVGKESVIDIK